MILKQLPQLTCRVYYKVVEPENTMERSELRNLARNSSDLIPKSEEEFDNKDEESEVSSKVEWEEDDIANAGSELLFLHSTLVLHCNVVNTICLTLLACHALNL